MGLADLLARPLVPSSDWPSSAWLAHLSLSFAGRCSPVFPFPCRGIDHGLQLIIGLWATIDDTATVWSLCHSAFLV